MIIKNKGEIAILTHHRDINKVQAYLNGDQRIEKWIYNELNRLIYHLISRMEAKGVFFHDRENVVSEVIFHVMIDNGKGVLRSFDGRSKLFTYLWPIVRNKIIDIIRKESRTQSIKMHSESMEKSAPDHDISSKTGTVEALILEHIENEPPLEKYIKYAKWMGRFNYQEIIERVNEKFTAPKPVNYQKIGYILYKNRKSLQKKLKNYSI